MFLHKMLLSSPRKRGCFLMAAWSAFVMDVFPA